MFNSQQHMVCSLLQIYTKLRQLPRLFSEILSVICQPALDHLRPPLLSEEIFSSLRTCLLDIPPSQGLEICSGVLETIRRYILPDLRKDDMEMDDESAYKGILNDRDKGDASLKLFSLSQLLHAVLFNLKTLDNTSPLPIVRQSHSLMKDIQQAVRELILVLPLEMKAAKPNLSTIQKTTKKGKRKFSQNHSEKTDGCIVEALWVQKTHESALLLRYTWVEVNTLFLLCCSKYTPLDEGLTGSKNDAEVLVLVNLESFTSLRPDYSPMSFLLHKLLTLQQMKKVLLDTASPSEPSTAALLSSAAHSVLAETEFLLSLDEEQAWNRQIASVNSSSYPVAHWYIIVSNLPLIVPHLSGEDVGSVADALVSSLLNKKTTKEQDCLPGYLTTSRIFLQLLQSSVHSELPTLFSATVHSLNRGVISIFKEAHVSMVVRTLFEFPEKECKSLKKDASQSCSKLFEKEALVQEILASLKSGTVAAVLTNEQNKELLDLLNILTHLNPDGMNSEDISSSFLLLLFVLASTSAAPESEDDSAVLVKLLRIMTCLVEGRTFQSTLKHIHGGTLLQAVVASLSRHSNNGRFQTMCCSHWLDIISASRDLITSLVQLIINRNSSVRLNLDQFTCYLTGKEMASRQDVTPGPATSEAELVRSRSSDHLLLAVLTSFAQAVVSNLGRSKSMDQTLAQILMRTTSSLGQAVKFVLKPKTGSQSGNQPASILSQAFLVEVVTVMLRCELSSLSVELENEQTDIKLSHMNLYQGFCQQILKEICSAQRPMDFLVSSLHFLSLFYKVLNKTGGNIENQEEKMKRKKELDELYTHILQTVHRLMSGIYICVKLN